MIRLGASVIAVSLRLAQYRPERPLMQLRRSARVKLILSLSSGERTKWGWHGHPDPGAYHLRCRSARPLPRQHAADRRTHQAHRTRDRHYYWLAIVTQLSREFL